MAKDHITVRLCGISRMELEAAIELRNREDDARRPDSKPMTAEDIVGIAIMYYLDRLRERQGLNPKPSPSTEELAHADA